MATAKIRMTAVVCATMLAMGIAKGIAVRITPPAHEPTTKEAAGPAGKIVVGPYLQNAGQTEMTIMWETDKAYPSMVKYGPTARCGMRAVSRKADTFHEIKLTGLKPQTTYHYRVKSGSAVSADYTFRTAPERQTPFRVALFADSHNGKPTVPGIAKVVKGIVGAKPHIVIGVGDIVDNGGKKPQWKMFFDAAGELAARVPIYLVRGNHDGKKWYLKYVSNPGNETESGNEQWFAFTYGNVFFMVLDSNELQRKYAGAGIEQLKWFEKALTSKERKAADWTIVLFHHPLYSRGQWAVPALREPLQGLFEKHHVDLVINGHDHHYARGALNGVHYVITGGGGGGIVKRPVKKGKQQAPHLTVFKGVYHFCVIKVSGGELRLTARLPDGKKIDSFVIRSRKPKRAKD